MVHIATCIHYVLLYAGCGTGSPAPPLGEKAVWIAGAHPVFSFTRVEGFAAASCGIGVVTTSAVGRDPEILVSGRGSAVFEGIHVTLLSMIESDHINHNTLVLDTQIIIP